MLIQADIAKSRSSRYRYEKSGTVLVAWHPAGVELTSNRVQPYFSASFSSHSEQARVGHLGDTRNILRFLQEWESI